MHSFMKKALALAAIATLCVFAAGCGNSSTSSTSQEKKEVSIGVTPGLHAEIMDQVKKEAAKQGITIKVVEFSDFVTPDEALNNKEIDMNSFQHKPYMDNMVKNRGYQITAIGKTIVAPIAAYSHKIKNVSELQNGAKVSIPNDPTNGARALLLLQKAGLLKLKDGIDNPAKTDIVENPKNLQLEELDAAQVPRSLDDVDLAVINTNYALEVGLDPIHGSLFREDKDSPYAAIIAVREADKDNATYKKIVDIYHSDAIRKFIEEHFKGSVIPAF